MQTEDSAANITSQDETKPAAPKGLSPVLRVPSLVQQQAEIEHNVSRLRSISDVEGVPLLLRYETARTALAQCEAVDECLEMADKAAADSEFTHDNRRMKVSNGWRCASGRGPSALWRAARRDPGEGW